MRNASLAVVLGLLVTACGSTGPDKRSTTSSEPGTSTGAFTPPPVPQGFTRLEAKTITDIAPGADVTHCQYVMAPFDRDLDIVAVQGKQSTYGHHAVAFSYTPSATDTVGSEVKCMMDSTEFTSGMTTGATAGGSSQNITGGAFLGAVSSSKTPPTSLPDGVAFRLTKGSGVVLNLHYINPSAMPVNGDAYMDLKLAEVDPTRLIAALFVNINATFQLPPSLQTDSSVDCVAKSDVSILMMANHMHEYGTHATTSVVHADTGAVDVLRDDPVWSTDMVNNPIYTKWGVASPFVLHAGDTIRTSCSWDNTTSAAINFPREMCISAGFALTTGDHPTAPLCYNGTWVAQ